ncbi:MAG: ATP synthase F1 subunit epsilon [Deltaproteobacteria bacterium]
MAERLQLQVITPTRLAVSEEVDEVAAPGELGEFGVLAGHTPFITILAPGELRYKKANAETKLLIWGGVAEVRDDKVSVITDSVENIGDINRQAARAEAERLEQKLRDFTGSDRELKELNRSLKIAQLRAGI